jgi:hypothetical protein
MRYRSWGACAGYLGVLLCVGAARADSSEVVDAYLRDLGASNYTIRAITEDYVGRTFPGIDFFEVYFRQFPVAFAPPEGLSSSNLFAVVEGQVVYLTSIDELNAAYASGGLIPVGSAEAASDTARSWARFAAALRQDGFYSFHDAEAYVEAFAAGGFWAVGGISVSSGGSGYLAAYMEFDADGVLTLIVHEDTVEEGVRPICQATKLLDPDPLVRRMAISQLRAMGRAARSYLDEQRARATPELQAAIDRAWQEILSSSR